jgi:uncharacterized protein (DUF433 family)
MKMERGPVRGGGTGGFHDLGGDIGAQQVIQKLMRQAGAAALAQDDGAIAVQRKTLGRIDERQLRRGIDGLLRGGLPRRGPAESKLVMKATGPKAPRVNLSDEVIVKDLDILGGTPVFRGTRVPFQALLDYLEGGQTLDEFIDDFPTVTREAAISALELAKSVLVGQLG